MEVPKKTIELPFDSAIPLLSIYLDRTLIKKDTCGVPVVAQWLTNPTRNHEVAGSIPGLCSVGGGSGIAMSCVVGQRCGSDLALLWLWCRLAATAPIGPLAWEPPYAAGAAQEMAKRQKKNQNG